MANGPRWLWSSPSLGARIVRVALLPAAGLFRAATVARNALYSAGVLPSSPLPLPSISVGNLTVGGTGKTPVSQWIAAQLAARGARPAILLRGYGNDEGLVHRALGDTIVIENADRVAGAREALAQGADVAVLDDGFQHRRAERTADIVLVSADAMDDSQLPLPAGPWRESLAAVRRADLVIVTRKAVPNEVAIATANRISGIAPDTPVTVVHLAPDALVNWVSKASAPLGDCRGKPVLVVSGIGDPEAFEDQVRASGAIVMSERFGDHHEYTTENAQGLFARIPPGGVAICTLKDAVKLGPLWPREGAPLWYLSQRISLVRGADSLAGLLDAVLASRQAPAASPNP